MRVFVLCTGRCGSLTFAKACGHLTNFTAGHETGLTSVGSDFLRYPDQHIEVDNRLVWMLGLLEQGYGDDSTRYLWLRRRTPEVVDSQAARIRKHRSMVYGFGQNVLRLTKPVEVDAHDVAHRMVQVIESNLRDFLYQSRFCTRWMSGFIEDATDWFGRFAAWIGADGDLDAARRELTIHHNARKL